MNARPDEREDPERPSSTAGLVVALLAGLGLSGFAVAGMGLWETQQPLFAVGFVVLLPMTMLIVRALKSIL